MARDGRFPDPITVNSRGNTRIIFGTQPSRVSPTDTSVQHNFELGPVFVNDPALQAITKNVKPFPVGSVLVREKLAKADAAEPELLAVMIKREKGFNPDGGDWQFLITNAKGTKIKLNQKTGDCLNCHVGQASSDYVHPLK